MKTIFKSIFYYFCLNEVIQLYHTIVIIVIQFVVDSNVSIGPCFEASWLVSSSEEQPTVANQVIRESNSPVDLIKVNRNSK